jgi:hypothetical protein
MESLTPNLSGRSYKYLMTIINNIELLTASRKNQEQKEVANMQSVTETPKMNSQLEMKMEDSHSFIHMELPLM